MLKKLLSFIIVITMLYVCTAPCAKAETADFSSILHTSDAIREIMADDIIFMTSNTKCYISGEKKDYSEYCALPYNDENGILFVPCDIIADAFSFTESVSGGQFVLDGKYTLTHGSSICTAPGGDAELEAPVTVTGGVFFVPVESFCKNVLGKYIYNDERGYVLISDEKRDYLNDYKEIWEISDSIFRYMHYDRPDGQEIFDDAKEHGVLGTHPRMLATKEELDNLMTKISANTEYKYIYENFISQCDGYLDDELMQYDKPDGLRLYAALVGAGVLISNLGVAYQLSDDEKYAERAWEELENILSWRDWNCDNHFLDSGEAVPHIVRGYDCIYDYLSEERRALFVDRFQKLYLDYAVGACTGDSQFTLHDSRYTHSNWGAICGNGMIHAALCLIDAESEDSLLTQKCKFLASQVIQSLEFPFGNIFPSGTTSEGFVYWDYYFSGLTRAADIILRTCGEDYALVKSPSFDQAGDFGIYGQTSLGVWTYSATSMSQGVYFPMSMFLHSKITGNTERIKLLELLKKELGVAGSISYLLWNDDGESDGEIDYPLSYYAPGEELSVMKSSWDTKNGLHVAVVGGTTAPTMTDFDKGSFVFEALGERWFVDLGNDNYNVSDGGSYWDLDVRKRLYRLRTEGHNSIVINPTPDTFGQDMGKTAKVIRNENKSKGGISVYDLSEVYDSQVDAYKRGFYLCDNRNALMIQDELTLRSSSEIYWFLHTEADIELSSDGKGATLRQNGKEVSVAFYTNLDSWHLEVMDAEPLSEQTKVAGEYSREGIRKLVLRSDEASGDVVICAKVIPVAENVAQMPIDFKPIDEWAIPDGTINTLKVTSTKIFEDLQDFNSMSDAYKNQSKNNIDTTLFDDFSKDFGWTVTGENVFIKRGAGKSGDSGDYAVEIYPFGEDNNYTVAMKLNSWTKKVNSGKIYLEYDWAVTPVQKGTSPVMVGIPMPGYNALMLADSDRVYETDFVPSHGEWMNMRYEYDVNYNTCSLWINDTQYWDERISSRSSADDLSRLLFRPAFYSGANYFTSLGAAKFCLDNFRLYSIEEEELRVGDNYGIIPQSIDTVFAEDGDFSLKIEYGNLSDTDIGGKLIVAFYDETETVMLGVNVTDTMVSSDGGTVATSTKCPEGAEIFKIMLLKDTECVQPMAMMYKAKIR